MTTTLAIESRWAVRPPASRYAWVDALVTSCAIAAFALALGCMVGESLGENPGPATYAAATRDAG